MILREKVDYYYFRNPLDAGSRMFKFGEIGTSSLPLFLFLITCNFFFIKDFELIFLLNKIGKFKSIRF